MKTRMLFAVGFVLMAGAPTEDVIKKEKEKLTGTWKVVSVEANGQTVPEAALKDFRFIFTADALTRKQGEKAESGAGYQLDPSRTPKWIDMTGKEDGKDHSIPALYALEGDTLTLCFRTDYKQKTKDKQPLERPTKLDGGKASEQVLMVLKREKP